MIKGSKLSFLFRGYVLICLVYWCFLVFINNDNSNLTGVFGLLLAILPLLAILNGFVIYKQWGKLTSSVGRSIFFVLVSLAAWFIGQSLYYILNFTGELPYPALPDYLFVLIDPMYAMALLQVMKYSGAVRNIRSATWSYSVLFVIPVISTYINYRIFFKDTTYFQTLDVAMLFDIIYSFGSIAIMSLTIITFALSVKKLGGKMKSALYLLFIGFTAQYIGDITFALLEQMDMSYNGNLADFIYFLSIALVSFGVLQFNISRLDKTSNLEAVRKETNVS